MGGEYIRFFYAYEQARNRLTALALEGLHRLGVAPEQADWYRVDGIGWVYGTSADIHRAMREPVIDDSAAREWMRKGATLDVPEPGFGRHPDRPMTLKRADGSLWELDTATGEWIPLQPETHSPFLEGD